MIFTVKQKHTEKKNRNQHIYRTTYTLIKQNEQKIFLNNNSIPHHNIHLYVEFIIINKKKKHKFHIKIHSQKYIYLKLLLSKR